MRPLRTPVSGTRPLRRWGFPDILEVLDTLGVCDDVSYVRAGGPWTSAARKDVVSGERQVTKEYYNFGPDAGIVFFGTEVRVA